MTASVLSLIGTLYATIFFCIGQTYVLIFQAVSFFLLLPTWIRIQGYILYFGSAAVVGLCLAGRGDDKIRKFFVRPLIACLVAAGLPLVLLLVVTIVAIIVVTIVSVMIIVVVTGCVAVVLALLWLVLTFHLLQAFYWWDLSYLPMGLAGYVFYTLVLWSRCWVPIALTFVEKNRESLSRWRAAKKKQQMLLKKPWNPKATGAEELADEVDFRPGCRAW